MTGPADWGAPGSRPQLDLSLLAGQLAESAFRRIPPAEINAVLAKVKAATKQVNQQQQWIATATEILQVVLKVALV